MKSIGSQFKIAQLLAYSPLRWNTGRQKIDMNAITEMELVDMFCKCGDLETAEFFPNKMPGVLHKKHKVISNSTYLKKG